MSKKLCNTCLATVLIIANLLIIFPTPAIADGGLVIKNRDLWTQLEEGQQTAVVTLAGDNTAHVDLFISLLDNSGASQQVVFFVPLGSEATNFKVVEKTSLDFAKELTGKLDETLRVEAERENKVRFSLLAGSISINGAWVLPFTLALALSGCGLATAPEATFKMDSSRVDIYGIDENTDIETLINTTGLDASVKDTLARLRGQKIALVTLQTQPPVKGGGKADKPTGQPGIHLAWATTLVSSSAEATYIYPLGTGAAWAHPIGITGVYVVAPPGVDFTVRCPELGADYSGYLGMPFGRLSPRIASFYNRPAFAIDQAEGDFGRIWRAIYVESNSAEDIVITTGGNPGFAASLQKPFLGLGMVPALAFGLVLALLLWVIAWRYTMPRLLKIDYHFGSSKLWLESLVCPGIDLAALAVMAVIAGLYPWLASLESGFALIAGLMLLIVVPVALISVLGVPGIMLSYRKHLRNSGASARRVVLAYVIVTLAANTAYLSLATGYMALTGVL